ncbi:unnamed protein product [Prunus brigantina]
MGKRKRDEAEKWVINEGDDIIETEKSDRSERFRVFYPRNFDEVIEARDFGENDQIEMAISAFIAFCQAGALEVEEKAKDQNKKKKKKVNSQIDLLLGSGLNLVGITWNDW